MNRNKEDIFESKVGVPGARINIRALLRYIHGRAKPDHIDVTTERFIQIFNNHGIDTTEIPRLISEVTLENLKSSESLLSVLTNNVIDKVAELFHVRKSWLEGNSSTIYDTLHCYKQPEKFFMELSKIKLTNIDCPVIAFTSEESLNNKSGREQPVRIVFEEKCIKVGDKIITRYRVWDDEWNWGYWKTRIQLKSMVRLVDLKLSTPVKVYKVDRKMLRLLENGKIVPYKLLRDAKRLENISLEDFTESLKEHRQAKELEELPDVLKYIEDHNLENFAEGLLVRHD